MRDWGGIDDANSRYKNICRKSHTHSSHHRGSVFQMGVSPIVVRTFQSYSNGFHFHDCLGEKLYPLLPLIRAEFSHRVEQWQLFHTVVTFHRILVCLSWIVRILAIGLSNPIRIGPKNYAYELNTQGSTVLVIVMAQFVT